ncbi:uncharacterized protein LOC133286272 [Gastrolobium bilobum]|uniref:uncharacterized protein LOC133286272 n=1 Tax=Gastrolobium bilobum TaxID=150636 RepID=UPI002AB07153|nr:uncharacterized protein LOC133286272 [Gastrolobium bilobum]
MMACSDSSSAKGKSVIEDVASRKPRILLAACGSVSAIKFGLLCRCFSKWAVVAAVVTMPSLRFIDKDSIPQGVNVLCDEHDWECWKSIGDSVLHIELCKWADIMVIAPLSANTLGKIVGGLSDNLLTCIVRAWDNKKQMFVAPAMNLLMWNNPLTEQQCMSIEDRGIALIRPVNGAMAEPERINATVRHFYHEKILKKKPGENPWMMACSTSSSAKGKSVVVDDVASRKPRIIVAACGSVSSAVNFGLVCKRFLEWATVAAVVTRSSLRFIDKDSIPQGLKVLSDEHDWNCWKKIGDSLLHIELCKWADIMVIAPLSANTLGMIAGGLCDNLLTCIVRAWDSKKQMFVAPSMNLSMWNNPLTEQHCVSIEDRGIALIPPVNGAMAEPERINAIVRSFYSEKILKKETL